MIKSKLQLKFGYANNGACSCPKCNSWNIKGGIHELNNLYIIVRKHCNQCNTTWDDHFEFKRYNIQNYET